MHQENLIATNVLNICFDLINFNEALLKNGIKRIAN